MSDRELLEAAARAGGLEFNPTVRDRRGLWVVRDNACCQSDQRLWNSLTSLADAIRLALKLRLHIRIAEEVVTVWRSKDLHNYWTERYYDRGEEPALCRAITCAAAYRESNQ